MTGPPDSPQERTSRESRGARRERAERVRAAADRRAATRRRFLAASASLASAGLAGCAADGLPALGRDGAPDDGSTGDAPGDEPAAADGESALAPPDDAWPREGQAVALETGPRIVALTNGRYLTAGEFHVRAALEAPATSDSPTLVRAAVENVADRAQAAPLWTLPPFEDPSIATPGTGTRSLYLVPTAETPIADGAPAVERGPGGYWRLAEEPGDALPDSVGLEPDETVVAQFYLVGDLGSQGFPTDEYAVGSGDGETAAGELALSVWDSETPGPSADSRFEPGAFPDLPTPAGDPQTVWFHDADESTPRYLRPDPERAELPAASDGSAPADADVAPAELTFELVNRGTEALTGGGGTFDLWKFVDGEWAPLSPRFRTMEMNVLPPGNRLEWTLDAYHGAAPDGGEGRHTDTPVRGHLGGGTYAFRATFTLENRETYAAAFDLVGGPVEVEPREDLDVERRGDRVVVAEPISPELSSGRLVVTRVDDADDAPERLLPEQVMGPRDEAYRDVLPFFEPGVETVEFHTDTASPFQVLGDSEERRRFLFEGDVYEARWEDDETR